ncbi:MAG: peroxide stress protein YaaA [Gammaproteobacteria bacterium]|nr:peroxide stress protein YaaA [Gammaproteobacteria bacterium]
MISVISPAKSLDYESQLPTQKFSQPEFLDQSNQLIEQLRKLAPQDISSLMHLSDKLSVLNFDRYQNFSTPFNSDNARQALLAFKGDVYQGLDAQSFSEGDFEFAQKHLRMLSGLYGILKPLDLMQPYRLEMGTKFVNQKGKDLYEFWGTTLNKTIQNELSNHQQPVLINLASNEYFKSLQTKDFPYRIINVDFKDWKNDKYKIISFFAKKARGLMSRYIIQNRIDTPEGLTQFNLDGYYFDPQSSSDDHLIFLRDEKPA